MDRALHPTEGIGVNEAPGNDNLDSVRAFYDAGPDHEWTRLERRRTEFALTWRAISLEGIVSMIEDKVNGLSGPLWEFWVDLNYRLAGDPTILGGAEHILYVGRKREG